VAVRQHPHAHLRRDEGARARGGVRKKGTNSFEASSFWPLCGVGKQLTAENETTVSQR
jgi:hypothetical protein